MQTKFLVISFASLYVITGVAIGVGLYFAGYNADHSPAAKQDVFQKLQEEISAANIDENLKKLSSVPHIAGKEQDLKQAEWIRDKFELFGLDKVSLKSYNVLLSYPNIEKPNKVRLIDSSGSLFFTTIGKQPPLYTAEENSTLVMPNFSAYSATGNITSDGLVYAYYGRQADFDFLKNEAGIDVKGKIVLARYGGGYPGNIVDYATKRGAIGVLLYSDPKDYAQKGRNDTYPDSWWMPGVAMPSGVVSLGNGDQLTPFYPAIESAYRIPESDTSLPTIPVQPISYDEAEVLLRALGGNEAPKSWEGNLNTTYSLGPEFRFQNMTINMEILTANERATTYNTIGMLYGEEEPDRYVLVGNHRDAWYLGATDPSSGTACMLEMARVFGKMKLDYGWRPRRTLVFASWGAEEYGLVGSYEWVEEHRKVLSQRAVAYLNVDSAVTGHYALWGKGVPLMNSVLIESTKKIKNPSEFEQSEGRLTVYDTWIHRYPDTAHPGRPKVNIIGSGSDHTSFMHILGVPSIDIRYNYEEPVQTPPLYHTLYETHHLVSNIVDKGFVHHRAIAQLWTEIARNLSESVVLPLDLASYATHLTESFTTIKLRYETQLLANNATLAYFEKAVSSFSTSTMDFTENTLRKLDQNSNLAVRRVNDQLIQLERHFIDPLGLPNRPEYNHIVFAPSSSNTYVSTSFSGLTDLLETVGNKTETQMPTEWAQIKHHLGVIAFFIEAAGGSLSDHL